MRNQLVLGIIGLVWGVLMLMTPVVSNGSGNTDVAFVFGIVLCLAGARAIMKYRSSRAADL